MKRLFFSLLLALFLVACDTREESAATAVSPTLSPLPTPEPAPTDAPTPLPVPDFLAVTLDETINLEAYTPSQPFILHFNQPMNPANTRPLLFSPTLNGQFTWSDNNTTLTFTPDGIFASGRTYQVTIHAALKSATGLQLGQMYRWRLTTLILPQITSRVPFGYELTERQPTIRLSFDQVMDQTSVADALQVQPAISLDMEWRGQDLLITPQELLDYNTTYHFTVTNTAVSQFGEPLQQTYEWEYRMSDGFSGLGKLLTASDPLNLNFDYPIDPTSLQVVLNPEVAGGWTWNNDHTIATFTPDGRFPNDTTMTVRFTAPLRDAFGDEIATPETQHMFTPSAILQNTPQGYHENPLQNVQIVFDRLMDETSTAAAFSITPPVTGTISWQETTLIFTPGSGYLAEFTDYRVTIAPTALDSEGEIVLSSPYTWSFRTDQLQDVANFGWGANAQVLDANGRRAIQFQYFSQEEIPVSFELYNLSLPQFLDRYASGFRGVVGWEPDTHLSTADTTLLTSWPAELVNSVTSWGITIYETFIPADVPPGLYLLNLEAGRTNAQLIVLLTSNTLVIKQAENQLLAWVTDINGAAKPGIEVAVYARDGELITSGTADNNGVFRTQLNRTPEPLIVIAREGTDITAAGFTGEWRSYSNYYLQDWWRPRPTTQDYSAYILTERPIYQPGQTVYFKAIIRQDDDAVLTVLPAGTPVTARIRDSRNNVVQTIPLVANNFGTVNGEFQLAEGAMLGDWAVEIVMAASGGRDSSSHKQIFKVEEYRKPDYQVTVTSNVTRTLPGDTIQVTVDSRYLFGEPVPNASLEIRFYDLQPNNWWQNISAGLGEGGDFTWYESYNQQTMHGETDKDGRFTFTFNAETSGYYNEEDWNSNLRRSSLGIEVTVDDGSHQTVTGYTVVHTYNTAEYLSLENLNYLQTPGEPFNLQARVQTIFNEPVNGRVLTITLRRWQEGSGGYATVGEPMQMVTDANGQAVTPFTIAEPGYYKIRVTGSDRNGRPLSYNTWVYAFQEGWWGEWYNDGALSIVADKDSYAPGDTAQLLIQTSITGPALLTFERGTIRRELPVQLTAPFTYVEVPILADDAPNIFVTVAAWQARDTTLQTDMWNSLSDSQLFQASTELSVPVTDKTLVVTITPDQSQYAPRQEASFTVRVTNRAGVPVSAELSLALVDEAIFSLSDDLSGLMFDAFYYRRSNIINTFDSMQPYRYFSEGGMGGGGGDQTIGNPRQDFPDTAAWFPVLHTDFNGEATVTVTLPDSLTSWRLTAKAVTADTQVGEAIVNITTHQETIVRPILPPSLTAGDSVQISAVVHNYAAATQMVEVTLQEVDGLLLSFDSPVTQTVELRPGAVQVVGWQVQAATAGATQVVVQAVGELASDAVLLPLEIRPLAIPDVTTEIGQFTTSLNSTITLPADALPIGSLRIELSRSIAGTMLTGLEYLTGYPYGCVEQTMSRALPNAVVARALSQLGVTNLTLQAELPSQVNASLQRLYGFQHNDGGWGWWYDDHSDNYQTAWVIFGLSTIRDAGYEVDESVIQRGVEWLTWNLQQMDDRTRAYALYSMAVAGQPDLNATLAQAEQTANLDTFSLAGLALALHAAGETAVARQIVDGLAETAVSQNGLVYWSGADEDGYYHHKTMASDIRSTALALSALVKVRPGHELETGIVRYLMSQRRTYGWGSTNETSYAILALTDHLLASRFSETAVANTYSVRLNGELVANGSLGPGQPSTLVEIPATQLQTGENSVQITQNGNRPLFYTLNHLVYVAQEEMAADGNITVVRNYLNPETNQPLTTVQAGQLVRVQLRVILPQDGSFIIVEDNLPGGLEALNEGLNITSHVANQYEWQEPELYWQQYGYNHKEIRNGRVSFFITEFNEGSRTISYMARATHAGEFTAMPVEVYAMYDVTLWGRSASNHFVVAD